VISHDESKRILDVNSDSIMNTDWVCGKFR